MTLLYFLVWFNMCFPLLIINLDLSHEEWILDVQRDMYFDFAGPKNGAVLFFGGKFSDTNRAFLN